MSSGVYANSLNFDQKQNNSGNISCGNQKSWVLMIYLDGDNNLDEIMQRTIQKIEEEGYCDDVKIFIQFDSYDLFEGIKRYEITDNGLDEIETITEKSMGDKTTLVEFILWCKQRCNADRYCLVLSDHGTGWMNGFLLDETDEDKYMSMEELRDALIYIKNNVLHQKIDLVVLDACLMGMTEIYYQIRDTTKVCVASPELHGGCPYKWILWDLYDDPFCDEKKLGEYFVDSYKTEYSIISVAAYDIEKISTNVSEKLNTFSDALVDSYNSVKEIIKESIDRAISYNGINPDGSDYVLNYKDLYGFTFHLSRNVEDVSLQNKAENLMDSLRDAKVYPHTNLGISIYLPTYNLNKDYRYKPEYTNLDLCQDTSWDELVEKTRSLIKMKPMNLLRNNLNLFRLISYLLDFDNF
jgi:hypothetical protein